MQLNTLNNLVIVKIIIGFSNKFFLKIIAKYFEFFFEYFLPLYPISMNFSKLTNIEYTNNAVYY